MAVVAIDNCEVPGIGATHHDLNPKNKDAEMAFAFAGLRVQHSGPV